MLEIEYNNGLVRMDYPEDFDFTYVSYEMIDEYNVNLTIEAYPYGQQVLSLLGGYTKINGVMMNNSQEIIDVFQ